MVLTRLKKAAELHFNMPVRDVVITVPAYFSDAQRQVGVLIKDTTSRHSMLDSMLLVGCDSCMHRSLS